MATRTLLKLRPNLNLPLRFFRNSSFSLARPESTSLPLFKPSTFSLPGTLARQMATARSPRGASRRDEDEDNDDDDVDFDDEDIDDGDEDEFDLNDEFDDYEDDEEEKPKGKKNYSKK